MKKKISLLLVSVLLLFIFVLLYFILINPIFSYSFFLKNAINENTITKKTIGNYFFEEFLSNNNCTITIKGDKAEFKKNSIIVLHNGVYNITDNRNGLNFHIEAEKLYINSISHTRFFHAVSINKKSLLSDSSNEYKLTAFNIFFNKASQKIMAFNNASIMFNNNNQYQAESVIYCIKQKILELKTNAKAFLSMIHFDSSENPISLEESNFYNEIILNADYLKADREKNSLMMNGHAVLNSDKNKISADLIYFKTNKKAIITNMTVQKGSLKSLMSTIDFHSLKVARDYKKSSFILENAFINHSIYGNFKTTRGSIVFTKNAVSGYKFSGKEVHALLYFNNLTSCIATADSFSFVYIKNQEIVHFKAKNISSEIKNSLYSIFNKASLLSGTIKKDSLQFIGSDFNYTHIDSKKNFMINGKKGKIINGNIYFHGNILFKNNLLSYSVTANKLKWLYNDFKHFYSNITLTSFNPGKEFTIKSQLLSINSADMKFIAEKKVYGFFTENNLEFLSHNLTVINNKPINFSQITFFSPLKCFNVDKGKYKINSALFNNSSFVLNSINFSYNNLSITIKNLTNQNQSGELNMENIAITYKDRNNKTHKIKAQQGLITNNSILQLSEFNVSTISSDAINPIAFELDLRKNQTVYYTKSGTSTYLIK